MLSLYVFTTFLSRYFYEIVTSHSEYENLGTGPLTRTHMYDKEPVHLTHPDQMSQGTSHPDSSQSNESRNLFP